MSKKSLLLKWANSDVPAPKLETLEDLFKDYDGGSFETELVDLGEPVGNEKW